LEETAVIIKKNNSGLAHTVSFFGSLGTLLYELGFASFEFFLARHTAKMVGFAFICDLVFGGVFV